MEDDSSNAEESDKLNPWGSTTSLDEDDSEMVAIVSLSVEFISHDGIIV